MQLNHMKTLQPAQNGIARVHAVAWSGNNKRLAVADHGRFIHLYDETGERRDRFGLKSGDGKEPKTFTVRGMAFSPDSVKLAVAQSDFIVFVYKLGLEWGERKSICNKFPQNFAVTCLAWPNSSTMGADVFAFGTAEGKVKVAILKTNKAQTIYSHDAPAISMAGSSDGAHLVTGHADGSILRYTFDTDDGSTPSGAQKLCVHPVAPYAIAYGESIAVGGNDCRMVFYDRTGRTLQSFEFDPAEDRDITVASFNPSGQTLALGAFNKLRLFNHNLRSRKWEEGNVISLPNSLSMTALTWKSDGSRVVTGTLCGAVDIFDACLKRYRLRGAFEFTYVSHNQVIVKRLSTGTRIVLKSHMGFEIQRVNVHKDRFLVAHTATTLLVGDLGTCKLSEISWTLSGREQFIFDNPQVCMVYVAGQLSLIEYGRNEPLGTCRTDNTNMHRISVMLHEVPEGGQGEARKAIAYLMDAQTIDVEDLITGTTAARITHPYKIDWLELNHRATKLLFRDKQRQLVLYDIVNQKKTTLLNFCTYVQWVPDSDVVVAQNRTNLCVYYSIDNPDRVTIVPIKGEVEGIERTPEKTEVIVDEGVNTVAYGLDESLIEFGTAMEDKDYDRACDLLDQISLTPETEAMWQNLSTLALADMRLYIAERCYVALGDVAKARALKRINNLAAEAAKANNTTVQQGYDHYTVRAELYILNQEFRRAEQIYLENGKVEKVIEMWDEMYRFEDSINAAEARNYAEAPNLRSRFYSWLMETRQEEKAGELREREGKYMEAINLYLRGGVPARAAFVVSNYEIRPDNQVTEAIAAALFKAGVFEKAGDFFDKLGRHDRAVDAYKKGHVYSRAVELARRVAPDTVVRLEDEWGDWLVAQKQVDQAINHYIEAHQYSKAIEAAINSRQWQKAVTIIETQNVGGPNDEVVKRFYGQIGRHYEQVGQLPDAEKYLIKAGKVHEVIEMYLVRGMNDQMYAVAQRKLGQNEIVQLFVTQAKTLEGKGDYAGAEAIYARINEPDKAIVMYKKARDFTNMIRLVSTYRPELVGKTHLNLGKQFENEKNFKLAEQHYIAGKDWGKAVTMYSENNMWDDAVRVAKVHGGPTASKRVVLSRALNIDAREGCDLLIKFTLVDAGIEAALEATKFDVALQWAQIALPQKLPYVFLKNAMYWEDQGEFRMAEEAFIKAGKPREAIDMYVHQHDFERAMHVAETHDPSGIPNILAAQGRVAFAKGEFKKAEECILRANAPEQLLKLYKESHMLTDAQRIAREYCPDKLSDLSKQVALMSNDQLIAGRMLEDNGDYLLAIEAYLKVTKDHPKATQAELVKAWVQAVKLAMIHSRHSVKETLKVVIPRLMEFERHDEAAKLLEDCEDYKQAITVYCRGGRFEQAEALAQRISPEMVQFVQQAKVQFALNSNKADITNDIDDLDQTAALKIHIENNDWARVLKVARGMGEEILRTHAAMYINYCVKTNNVQTAMEVIQNDPVDWADFRFFSAFAKLGEMVFLHLPNKQWDLQLFHDGLYQAVTSSTNAGQTDMKYAETILEVIHVYATAQLYERHGLMEFAWQLMATLPRYVETLPADKLFFDAGVACKNDNPSIAFVYLNRYLDIVDKIDDGETTSQNIDNFDFAKSDFPVDYPLPKATTVDRKISEEVKDWVLTNSVSSGIDPTLPLITDPRTGEQMFLVNLRVPGSIETMEACAVTGLAILSTSQKTRCKGCHRTAKQEAWNKVIMAEHKCPWCKTHHSIEFSQ